MMEKTGKVKFINSEIKKLEKLKIDIQSECKHKETEIKFIEGGNTPREICKECEKDLRYPDREKLELFLFGRSDTDS